jgi:hypothetical protein
MRLRFVTTLAATLLFGFLTVPSGVAGAAVSSAPAATPQLVDTGPSGSVEKVRQIVQCGTRMYAVGKFSQVRNAGSTANIVRNNAFSFSATGPYAVTTWNPNVNGQVDTVECAPDGSILLGGTFTTAGGQPNRNLARVNATTGASLSFAFHPAGQVAHVESVQDVAGTRHLLVGGFFTGFLRSVNPVTGADDGYRMPTISGNYQYPGVAANGTRIWNMTVSPDGRAVLMAGDFTSVGGQHHEQIFRLNLTSGAATVSAWAPTELETHCADSEPFYARDAGWSPDGTRIYTATTGFKVDGSPTTGPRTGPCDAIIAYPVTQARFAGHSWINYTGCDSLYSVAADAQTVFAGGHQRWVSNPQGCDQAGPGAIAHPGLTEVSPTNGAAQPGPDRGRGVGAEDLLRTTAGLWVASDNFLGIDTCAGKSGHMGICFLPN